MNDFEIIGVMICNCTVEAIHGYLTVVLAGGEFMEIGFGYTTQGVRNSTPPITMDAKWSRDEQAFYAELARAYLVERYPDERWLLDQEMPGRI